MASQTKFAPAAADRSDPPLSIRLPGFKSWFSLIGAGLFILLWLGYFFTGQTITLEINGQTRQIRTHDLSIATIIRDLELPLTGEDLVWPDPKESLSPGDRLTIQLARPVMVEADGQSWHLLTQRQSVAELAADIGLIVNPRDELFINGAPASLAENLPDPKSPQIKDAGKRLFAATTPRVAIETIRSEPVQIRLYRAIPITLHHGQANSSFYTARQTIREAFDEQGITLFPEDKVTPDPETRLTPGMNIFIERATPVTILADGQTIRARTHQDTVGQILAEAGIPLVGQDFSRPGLDQTILANGIIELVRVLEMQQIEAEYIPFETGWIPDENLELDQQEVRQKGVTGVIKTRTRARYENGQEIWREIEDEWLDQEPSNRIVAYGTKVVIRTLETEAGPIEYWRKIPMLATAYNAASSGKAYDHPRYGITRSGLPAGYGVVAVDPRVIRLRTNLYIPDYGPAIAGDTGGSILGKHIDLGFDDEQPPPIIYEWRDVYVLTPAPSPSQIRYVLPQWPQR